MSRRTVYLTNTTGDLFPADGHPYARFTTTGYGWDVPARP